MLPRMFWSHFREGFRYPLNNTFFTNHQGRIQGGGEQGTPFQKVVWAPYSMGRARYVGGRPIF